MQPWACDRRCHYSGCNTRGAGPSVGEGRPGGRTAAQTRGPMATAGPRPVQRVGAVCPSEVNSCGMG